MKREKFLWPLTQAHHRALVTAKRVREQLTADPQGEVPVDKASIEVKRLFDWELKQHFKDEEEMLVLFEERVGKDDPDSARVRGDHRLLESLVPQKTRESLLLFAETIVAHVRFEEDVLFGRLEKAFKDEEKQTLGERPKLLPLSKISSRGKK